MQPKPEPFSARYAEAFTDPQVVNAYRFRPPYPQEVFAILLTLLPDEPQAILDVGAGDGDLARPLVEQVARVDAVDRSPQMIAQGKLLPQGNHPRLHWILGRVEEAPLTPPYALITAGSSIHWTEWSLAFPRFCSMLMPAGRLALVSRRLVPMPWSAEVRRLREQFSVNPRHRKVDVVEELEKRHWFHKHGEQETRPVSFIQTIDDFLEGQHVRSGCTRERMGTEQAKAFDQQVRSLLESFHPDGLLPLQVLGTVTWGTPQRGELF